MPRETESPPRPRRRRVQIVLATVAAVVGIALGIGSFTFFYAEGASYLTNRPESCANCHVMQAHFDAWQKSSHHAVAVCNDCHAPHDSFVEKYWVKAVNGFNHSLAFTTNRFHEPIQITDFNQKVTEAACRHCHQELTDDIEFIPAHSQGLSCIRCHRNVGHALFE